MPTGEVRASTSTSRRRSRSRERPSAIPARGKAFIRSRTATGGDHSRSGSPSWLDPSEGTAAVLQRSGIASTLVRKASEGPGPDGEPTIVDLIRDGEVDMVINTPSGQGARADGYAIRAATVAADKALATTIPGLAAAVQAIEAERTGEVRVRSLQEHAGGRPRVKSWHAPRRGDGREGRCAWDRPHPDCSTVGPERRRRGLAAFVDTVLEVCGDVGAASSRSRRSSSGTARAGSRSSSCSRTHPQGVLTILDVGRGDIGSTMSAYARPTSWTARRSRDAITVSPYPVPGRSPRLQLRTARGAGCSCCA